MTFVLVLDVQNRSASRKMSEKLIPTVRFVFKKNQVPKFYFMSYMYNRYIDLKRFNINTKNVSN